jgi:hypothetical protein
VAVALGLLVISASPHFQFLLNPSHHRISTKEDLLKMTSRADSSSMVDPKYKLKGFCSWQVNPRNITFL